jgi:two-component system phosphate regulon sensor histidine kinase PhoR
VTTLLAVLALVAAVVAAIALARLRSASAEARRTRELARSVGDLTGELHHAVDERRSMELILSSMEDGVLLVDGGGRVRFANRAVEQHLGTRPASVAAVLPLGLQEGVRRAGAEGRGVAMEVETGTPNRWLRGSAVPVREDGSVLLVIRDVTEAKRLDSIRRDFVANASHELKTPAASIQAAAETLLMAASEDPAVVPRFAEQLDREALRLSRIVSDLLDLSRLETGSELGGPVDVAAVLREECERFDAAAGEVEVGLVVDVVDVPLVRGSAQDLALMVRNLVDNAIRYTRPGGRVGVALRATEGSVVITISDTGIGIPSRELPRIFERFYRVDRARSRETGGTGLGLSIVKHIVENHGGTITVKSELGRGSSFEVLLPTAT